MTDDGGGNLRLILLSKTDQSGSMIFKSEVHLHAPQTKTEHFSCVYGQTVILKNCIIVRKHLDHLIHLVTWKVYIVTSSNATL